MKFETLAIHAGQEPDPTTGAVMTPVYLSSTYVQEAVGKNKGYEYSRTGNPTRSALEACIAELEGARFGLAFSSGMATTDMIARLLGPERHIVAGNDVYGGVFRLFDTQFRSLGYEVSFVDATAVENIEAALQPNTGLVWLETPTNPLLNLTDLAAVSELVKSHPGRPILAVDNTFASPYLQQPIGLGADLAVHSTTKYLGGHSDVVGGALATNREDLFERLAFLQNTVGAVPGPLDCFLVLRGIKTLPVRMDRHSLNASRLADYFGGHPQVQRLRYPHHPSHPQYDLACRQMNAGGGMITMVLKGGAAAAHQLVASTRIFALAESLGGVESLIEVPAAMTHLSTSKSPLAVDPGLIRLSVGLEHSDDLIADLEQALESATT